MLSHFVLTAAVLVAIASLVAVPLWLASASRIDPRKVSAVRIGLLWLAGLLSGIMTLIIVAVAAWGMDTRLPWGLGVYPYLIPALSLPAFLVLKFASPVALSRVFWFLAAACGPAWYFGDRADRIASGFQQVSDLGMFLNLFTFLLLAISVLVQMAAICWRREQAMYRLADAPIA